MSAVVCYFLPTPNLFQLVLLLRQGTVPSFPPYGEHFLSSLYMDGKRAFPSSSHRIFLHRDKRPLRVLPATSLWKSSLTKHASTTPGIRKCMGIKSTLALFFSLFQLSMLSPPSADKSQSCFGLSSFHFPTVMGETFISKHLCKALHIYWD